MPRKLKSHDGNPYEIIRGMWEGAYVSRFLRLFQSKFGFYCLTTEDLEEALVDDESVVLADIIARLLRYVTENLDIVISNFACHLKLLLIDENINFHRFVEKSTTWQELSPEEKLEVLKWLIDHVCEKKEEDISDYLDENYSADDLRGICAGHDAFNNVYWYLDDLRLYREFSHKRQSKKDWECVCLTLSDWQSFIKQFRKTSNLQEKELYAYLNFELFPFVELELLNSNKVCRSKTEANELLINQEQRELAVMLEKRKKLDSNKDDDQSDINGSDALCQDNPNDTKSINSTENKISDFTAKNEDAKNSNMNVSEGHLNATQNICSVSSSICSTTMDVQIKSEPKSCSSNCITTSANTQDELGSSTSGKNSGNGINFNNSTVSASSPIPSEENLQDVNIQHSLSDIPSDNSSVASNKENAPPSCNTIGNEIPPMSAISNMVASTSTPATTASVQPLPSNMVNKTSFQMETQYMQQQSQIFVFSTNLANKAADSYLSGTFPSIIAFHCAQPGTKSFLEKYPLKVQQFNRQNPTAWLNSIAQMKESGNRHLKTSLNQYTGPHINRLPGPSGGTVCTGTCNMHGPNVCSSLQSPSTRPNNCIGQNMMPPVPNDVCPQSWSAHPYGPGMFHSSMPHRFPNSVTQGLNARQVGPSRNPMLDNCVANMNHNDNSASFPNPSLSALQMGQAFGNPTSLTGIKVPDENLTPQQRQHREEQLAMIRKMQQLLFPEQQQMDPAQNMLGPGLPGMPPQHGSQPQIAPGDMCTNSSIDGCFSPHQPCLNEHDHSHPPSDMYLNSGMMTPGFPQENYPPVSASAQLEWQKLQHQFYEERRRKHVCDNSPISQPHPISKNQTPAQQSSLQESMSQPTTPQPPLNSLSPNMRFSPGLRMQGPPPPYHQTNRKTMPSPHPTSPNTSSLSSPRMNSGLPSPADTSRQFPIPTPPGSRLPHPSPGSTTPGGSSSLHTTPLNSPKPLNTSGSGSNGGNMIRTPTTPSNNTSTPNSTPTSSCTPAYSKSTTPSNLCNLNRKQSQSCSELQDSNATGPVSINSEFPNSAPPSNQSNQGGLSCHTLHPCNHSSQKQDPCNNHSGICQKEPSLMPVPSPQQIQYLNSFDGQELTIHKQPNTGIKDLDMITSTSVPSSTAINSESHLSSHSQFHSHGTSSFPNTPGSCPSALESSQDSLAGQYSSAPASMENSMHHYTAPSPQMPGCETGPKHMIPASQIEVNFTQRLPVSQNSVMMRLSNPNMIAQNSLDENANKFPSPTCHDNTTFGSNNDNKMNIPRLSSNTSDAVQRFNGPNPHTNIDVMHSRFLGSSPHNLPNHDSISQPSQFSNLGSEIIEPQSFPSSGPQVSSQNNPCINKNFIENSMSHSYLQNLQKMTPPFENAMGNKISEVMSPLGQCSNSSVNSSNNVSIPPYNEASPLTSQGCPQRLSHFDPIASMAAMSECTGPLPVTIGGNTQTQNVITSSINMPNMQVASNSGSSNPSSSNFHPSMEPVQMPAKAPCSMLNQNQLNMHGQSGHNIDCGSQSMTSTHVHTTMPLQQMNSQNVTTSSYIGGPGPLVKSHPMHSNYYGGGANTISCSVTTNHPIMHSTVSTRTPHIMPGPRLTPSNFPGQTFVQREASPTCGRTPTMMTRGPMFNSANVQVKANAPNTIQYLPARPQQSAAPVSNRPPSLEFFQRFAAPLTNLDSKVPTHNLQYFPGSGSSNPQSNLSTNHGTGAPIAPGMMNTQRPPNMMMGPMMRGVMPNASHPNTQVFPIGSGLPGSEPPMFDRPPCPSLTNQMIPMNPMNCNQGVGMFSNKQMPLPMGGITPDATQPLPPSVGQTFSYKQSPFYGPTTADPNYAVQFHNFQQQLYATNTRNSQP